MFNVVLSLQPFSSLIMIRNFRITGELLFFPSRIQAFDALSMVLADPPRFSILPARSIWHLLISGQLKMLTPWTPWSVLREAKLSGRVYVRLYYCRVIFMQGKMHFSSLHFSSLTSYYHCRWIVMKIRHLFRFLYSDIFTQSCTSMLIQ